MFTCSTLEKKSLQGREKRQKASHLIQHIILPQHQQALVSSQEVLGIVVVMHLN